MTVTDRRRLETGFAALADGFALIHRGRTLLVHTAQSPAFQLARGHGDVKMYRGNFQFTDTELARAALGRGAIKADRVEFSGTDGSAVLTLTVSVAEADDFLTLDIQAAADFNRLQIMLAADAAESVWGGGEQMSYLNLKGRVFPMWTSEPGVGRDKARAITRAMDAQGMAGGDYWTTNYPQPTFLTSGGLGVHVDTTAYSVLDFTVPSASLISVWSSRVRIEFYFAAAPAELVAQLARRFGRQPQPPDWAISGAVIGLKDGARSFDRLEHIIAAGTAVTGLWCEDWVGVRETSFGRRLFWDWRWQAARYPALGEKIAALKARGIRFLGYVNPYIADDAQLFAEAESGGHLARRQDSDAPYLVDFGEFDCGIVDFTRPETCAWFAERVIGKEMLDFGLSGWMADFGEYLPVDVRLADGSDGMLAHNLWPVLWDAIAARGQTGEAIFFMRAGYSGVQAHCPLLWAGDQLVDFSRHDGLGTALVAALSSGLVGNAYNHADIGGYTSLNGVVRTAELLMRWAEYAAFTPVMRTHEGNRPDDNLQIDSTPEILSHFAAMSRVHAHLAPYVRALCIAAEASGLPLQRPLFLQYPDEADLGSLQDQYMYGGDLLVAPVITEGADGRDVLLPGTENWVHVWSGATYPPGCYWIAAPIASPPVFYRAGTPFADVFAGLAGARGAIS
jgi:sulfoquinovosidase